MIGMNLKSWLRGFVVIGIAALFCLGLPGTAQAQNLIKNPTAHPHYLVELEPHLLLDFIGEDNLGLGGRATFVIVDPGFVTTINNSVGIGVGLDWMSGPEHCNADGGFCHDHDRWNVPVVMQWNFWFTPHWSAFGEPGLAFRLRGNEHNFHGDDDVDLDVALYAGGRYNFNDHIALTMRLGWPAFSIGASFFL